MLIYILKRLGLAIIVMVTVSMISFLLLRVSGDPAISLAGEGASSAEIEFVRTQYGFDRPLIIQYFEWAGRAIQGDFGTSPYLKQPVAKMLKDRMGVTMTLGICSLTFAMLLAIPLGMLAAIRPNTWIDRLALSISVMGQAMPSFWFGLILIIFFGVYLRWLPISGSDTWRHFVMPTIALGYYATPAIMRLVRSGMLEVLASDHIRTARAKGLRWPKILFKHT
ncbi:MAG: ABC transporter permease, partial [Proteobacteria bacterium]|nr:ABC transporter permease [Pseudomonadota bacterium]